MAENKREIILKAAREVFSKRGFDGCSIREIAAQAGLNHQKITYYFQTKEKLFLEVIEDAFHALHEIGDSLVFDPEVQDPIAQYEAHLLQVAGYFETNRAFLKIIYLESLTQSPRMEAIQPYIVKLRNSVKKELMYLRHYGFGSHLPIDQVLLLFSGCFHALFIHPYLGIEPYATHPVDPAGYIKSLLGLLRQ